MSEDKINPKTYSPEEVIEIANLNSEYDFLNSKFERYQLNEDDEFDIPYFIEGIYSINEKLKKFPEFFEEQIKETNVLKNRLEKTLKASSLYSSPLRFNDPTPISSDDTKENIPF